MSEFDFSRELIAWYWQNKRDLPWRNTSDPYAIWVSEIMLQQTRVEAVKPYYHRFLTELPTISHLANADDEKLHKLWEGLGYYSRVRNMKKAAITCMEQYGGRLPETRKELLSLCGIGDYTAAAVGSIAFGLPDPAIDGNVLRVMGRYLAIGRVITERTVKEEIRTFLSSVIPKDDPGAFNSALMELGATLCGPDKDARCGGCPLLPRCAAFQQGRTTELPIRAQKAPKRIEQKTVFILQCEKKTAFIKRPEKGLLAGLWALPDAAGHLNDEEARQFLENQGCAVESITALPNARHVFTHIVWEMKGYLVKVHTPGCYSFFEKEEAEKLALPSAFCAYRPFLW